jgi:hypothetical protein
LAWDSAPVGDFGLIFDLADPHPSWLSGDEEGESATA